MDGFESLVKGMGDLSKGIDDMAKIIDNIKEGETPEDVAAKLGGTLDGKLSTITPLAPDVETAQQESETQILTKMDQLSEVVQEKIETLAKEVTE